MENIDNVNSTFAEDLRKTVKKGSKVSIASACFSIYAFDALKAELKNVESLRFIFTSPAFIEEKTPREKKEFYIPRLTRERGIYGTEFEVRLRNTLTQKALARECAEWIERKCEFRSNTGNRFMDSMMNVESGTELTSYRPVNEFTTVGLGCERGDSISNCTTKMTGGETAYMFRLFDQVWSNDTILKDVRRDVLDKLTEAYEENPPEFIYHVTLYNIFKEFLQDVSEDNLPNEGVGFRDSRIWKTLYPFQRDAVLGIINKLETYNGCILADSVGLGKTYTALGVIKYYESRNQDVLVLCPKKLSENWNTYRNNYKSNLLREDRFRYTVLFHTDLSRRSGQSNGVDLGRIAWGNYGLVVIDESHNFRNGGTSDDEEGMNRYDRLLKEVVRPGVRTKVLMLSATPVNNRFYDLYNQLMIAYEGEPGLMEKNLDVDKPLELIFREAQAAFNRWSELDPSERTTENLLKNLDYNFFKVLDSVSIARSRRHIKSYYGLEGVGGFPERLKPINLSPGIAEPGLGVTYEDINDALSRLDLAVYVPSDFILPSRKGKYGVDDKTINLAGREKGIRKLMAVNLLKRLESSVYSFRRTTEKILVRIEDTIRDIDEFERSGKNKEVDGKINELDEDEDVFAHERNARISLEDMDYVQWREYLKKDRDVLRDLLSTTGVITPENDTKLRELRKYILEKISNNINPGNRKILIFTSFSDTADYLYENLSADLKRRYGLNTAEITGAMAGRSTLTEIKGDFNDILTWFSPVSKQRDLIRPGSREELDVLIGTDCISEGQNLQDCDCCVNYDIHWNPVRIIQRYGRIDRIGSRNERIQLVNFWPDVDLDTYINLRGRVETRMKASIVASTGDDNPLDNQAVYDEHRRDQLKRLREECVDLEDMQSGVSIMDLGLNDFRIDLLEYTRERGELDGAPYGLHAVVPSSENMPPGVIFVLLNRVDKINKDNRNRLHPFYMVYVSESGEVVCDHLDPKKLLDRMRYACKGRSEVYTSLCDQFNAETKDGRDMSAVSALLSASIDSIIDKSEQSELEDFIMGRDSFSNIKSKGLDDFELICFLVVRRCWACQSRRSCAGRSPRTGSSPSSG